MSPEQERLAVQREAAASQHIVQPALELVRSSPTFRDVLLKACKPKRSQCAFCLGPNDGHVHEFGRGAE